MNRNFEIVDGIYLVQGDHELDLHNNFDFKKFDYSVEERKLVLNWLSSEGDWVNSNTPKAVIIEFSEVSEFPFMPREPEIPYTEDDCITSFGLG